MTDSRGALVSGRNGRWTGSPTVYHGEGAFWDPVVQTFRYVDMLAGDVVTDPDGQRSRAHLGDVAALIRSRREGGYVVADERGVVLVDDELRMRQRIPVFDDPSVRMNEGGCDRAGRLYCGSMAYDYRPGAGTLYRVDPDLSVHVVLESVTVPNGLVWPSASGDGVALHAETGDETIYAYEFDLASGSFGARTVFADLSSAPGAPDGMALDEEDGLWVAMFGGGAVRRFDADGALTDVLALPTSNVTSCAFGGPTGQTLLVTTSRQGIDDGDEPLAGRTFEIEVGVRGAAVHAFAG